jgi:hypothetical protein
MPAEPHFLIATGPLSNSKYPFVPRQPPAYETLSIAAGGDGRVIAGPQEVSDFSTWTMPPARDGAGFGLVSVAHGTCIARASNGNGAPLILIDAAELETNDLAIWRHDNVPGDYNAINSFADWDQKINIPGNGPYLPGTQLITWHWSGGAANELWQIQQVG